MPLAVVASATPSSPLKWRRGCNPYLYALFPDVRCVVGAGNCLYRAFVFALMEAVLSRPNAQLLASLRSRCDALWVTIGKHNIDADTDAARGHSQLCEFLERVRCSTAAAAVSVPPPLSLQGLEQLLRNRDVFDPLVRFARLATSCELRGNEERYSPFMAGWGDEGLMMTEVCKSNVEPMGKDTEHLQVAALGRALDVTFGIVDAGGSDIIYLQHPSGEGLPLFWLLHLSGHYEVVHPCATLDVRSLLPG